jgi:hypothetical protein
MAKSQKRSNREAKKPKQDKPKAADAAAPSFNTVFDRTGKSPKKK